MLEMAIFEVIPLTVPKKNRTPSKNTKHFQSTVNISNHQATPWRISNDLWTTQWHPKTTAFNKFPNKPHKKHRAGRGDLRNATYNTELYPVHLEELQDMCQDMRKRNSGISLGSTGFKWALQWTMFSREVLKHQFFGYSKWVCRTILGTHHVDIILNQQLLGHIRT